MDDHPPETNLIIERAGGAEGAEGLRASGDEEDAGRPNDSGG
jgi:hypothetical protein